jgi:hypothetical protein
MNTRAKPRLRVVESGDGVLVGQDWPLLPDSEYITRVTHWETAYIFRTPRLFLHVQIVDGAHTGEKLFAAFAVRELVGRAGRGGRFKTSRRSKLVRTLTRLTGQRIRGDRVAVDWLRRSLVRIKTRTVTQDSEQRPLAEPLRYSVVADIIAIEAGTPSP